ncbi:MAG: carboxypeptidase-like regulatory domain-containing protein [Sphingobacteriales bacterium]
MSKRETDISQINKYLKGELDANAMHQMERRAQEDPFLMDALEGFELTGGDQQSKLDVLTDRLKKRTAPKERRIIPWRLMSIAASVLIICAAGVWFFNENHLAKTPKLALTVKPEIKPALADTLKPVFPQQAIPVALSKMPHTLTQKQQTAKADTTVSVFKSVPLPVNEIANANIKDSVQKDTTPLDEMVVMDYNATKKKDITADKTVAVPDNLKTHKDTTAIQLLQGHVAGVSVNNSNTSLRQQNGAILNGKTMQVLNEIPSLKKSYASSKKILKGRVLGKDDGLPVVGATIKVSGTNIGAVTDMNGQFTLPADSSKTKLVVAFIGYQTRELNTRNRDSLKTILLQPAGSSLNEVVVTGYGTSQKNTEEPLAIAAHPQSGWRSFRKYLKDNAVSPDGKAGVVSLSFMVDLNGAITAIKVKKGLSKATDQAALDLINDGPDWVGNSNKKPEKVNLRVRFTKTK